MCLRGGGHERSPRHAVITHAALLSAMSLSVVKATLRYVCTLRPLPLSLSPQASCPSRGIPALPGCAHVQNTKYPPQTSPCYKGQHALTLQRPQSTPTLPSKEKQNWTEKRLNGPTLLSLSKLMTGPSRVPQRRVWLKMMTMAEMASQVVVLQCSYTLAFVCLFAIGEHHRARWFPCMSCMLKWQIASNAGFCQSGGQEG